MITRVPHAGRRPEPLRAGRRRDHHDGLQAGLHAEAPPADQTQHLRLLPRARHGQLALDIVFLATRRSLQKQVKDVPVARQL